MYIRNAAGEYERFAHAENLFYRVFDTVYPGESGELFVTFLGSPIYGRSLVCGEYRLDMTVTIRCELGEPDYMRVIWSGTPVTASSFFFTVAERPAQVPPSPVKKTVMPHPGRNRWLHTYEEFLSSYESIGCPDELVDGTMWVQPAPWTTHLTVKLLLGDEPGLAACAVPVEVESDSLQVALAPDNENYVIQSDGTRFPAITTQMMADMRGNVQISPYPGFNIVNDLLDMQEAGVNCLSTTVAFAFDTADEGEDHDNVDAFKFGADMLRAMGLRMDGLVCYPFGSDASRANRPSAERIAGRPLDTDDLTGYGSPVHGEIGGIFARYGFERYGDNYMVRGNGDVPLVLEDTRGWMRVDLHNRYPVGATTKAAFRRWLKERYGTVQSLNEQWGSAFDSFEAIDPEMDGAPGQHGVCYEYLAENKVFHDYSPAMRDFDAYRTQERVDNCYQILAAVSDVLAQGKIMLRTEGGNWLVSGIDPAAESPSLRHVLYSQRRCAAIAEIVQESGLFCAHSDYTTLPFTPDEVGMLTRLAVEQGLPPVHLPQFNRMRDIAINAVYGHDSYRIHYCLKRRAKGVFINTITALFPWFRATYENGGTPGILWQDYLCDGYATRTQFLEMQFFLKKLKEALDTPEGKRWRTDYDRPDDSFRKNARAKWSYDPNYIREYLRFVREEARQSKFCERKAARDGAPVCRTVRG